MKGDKTKDKKRKRRTVSEDSKRSNAEKGKGEKQSTDNDEKDSIRGVRKAMQKMEATIKETHEKEIN